MVKPFFTLLLLPLAASLDNNVANTPPLGWCSWQRYRCAVACNDATSPECFNEGLIKRTADAMLAGGYLAAGYSYIAIDDCWQGINAKGLSRDADGHIFADKKRFPSGIKALADYVHSKGFKFGLYTAIGNETCAFSNPRPPYPDHSHSRDGLGCDRYSLPKCTQAKRDIDDFVSWGIDYLKVDGCREADYDYMNSSYAVIGNYLQEAALREQRPPPLYHPSNLGFKFPRQFRELASIANQWRFFDDAQPSWVSVKSIIDELGAGQPICLPGPLPTNCTSDLKLHGATSTYCASYCVERDQFRSVAGRGGWHDPDMVLIGATNCSAAAKKNGMKCAVANWTHVEEELQMAIWAMNSAPIMMSTNVNAIPDASRDILLNAEVLAIDQDPLVSFCLFFVRLYDCILHNVNAFYL